MMLLYMIPSLILLVLGFSSWGALATTPASSTLYIEESQTTFSINLPENSTDVYFYFSSPASSWVAVGAGSTMAGSLMMIMYSAADNQHVTISPRIATGNSEPSFTNDVQVEVLDGSSIQNDSFVLNALCHGCRSWPGGSLSLSTRVQPFIYAFGPNVALASDSQTVGLRRHDEYGHFTMNMVQATGPGGVPVASSTTSGAALTGGSVKDGDKASIIHGVLMASCALILIPLDVIIIGLFKWTRVHMFSSGLLLSLILTGFGLGIYVSKEYNRAKYFNTAHQVLGFLAIGGLFVITLIGTYVRWTRQSSKKTGKIAEYSRLTSTHTWLARCVWILLLINNGIGMQFSGSSTYIEIAYGALAVGIALVMLPIYYCIFRRYRKKRNEARMDDDHSFSLTAYPVRPR